MPLLSLMSRDAFMERLAGVFERVSDVQAVFLFGSHASGTARPGSDVDLAVIGQGARRRRLDLLVALVEVGFDNVDLVMLDGQDIVLQFEAVRQNVLVYARDDFDRGSYYSKVVRQYFDFLPYLEVQRRALKERLARA